MRVPFVDLPRQLEPFQEDIRERTEEIMFERADFIMRQDLLDFEAEFARYVGTEFTVGVANGSDALNLAVRVLGISPGDEVITVSHTFVATIAAITHAGAVPVLVDVGPDHLMDPTLLERAITPRTKAIIPVHLNGRVCNMDEIVAIARRHNLSVIEDSAQAIGASYKGKRAGSFGVLSTNSFYPFKVLGCFGDGGAITTDDPELNQKLRFLRDNGQDRKSGEILYWGWNSRLDNLQAGVLSVMLSHIQQLIERRREIAKRYDEGLGGLESLVLPFFDGDGHWDVFQNYVVTTADRDDLVSHLSSREVGTLISWPIPTHHHKQLGLTRFSLPETERISREVLSLPMHPALTDAEVDHVIESVRSYFSK